MKFKALMFAGALALSAFAVGGPAAAAVIATYSGTITSGASASSPFGTQSLANKHFSFTATFEPSAGFHLTLPPSGDPLTTYHFTDAQSNAVGQHSLILRETTLEIDGQSDTLDWTDYKTPWQHELTYENNPAAHSSLFLLNGTAATPATGGSDVLSLGTRVFSPTPIPYALEDGWSPANLNPLSNFSASRAVGDPRNGYSLFYQVDAHIESLRLRDSSAAPEPAAWALMIAGFGLAGAMVRRRRVAA